MYESLLMASVYDLLVNRLNFLINRYSSIEDLLIDSEEHTNRNLDCDTNNDNSINRVSLLIPTSQSYLDNLPSQLTEDTPLLSQHLNTQENISSTSILRPSHTNKLLINTINQKERPFSSINNSSSMITSSDQFVLSPRSPLSPHKSPTYSSNKNSNSPHLNQNPETGPRSQDITKDKNSAGNPNSQSYFPSNYSNNVDPKVISTSSLTSTLPPSTSSSSPSSFYNHSRRSSFSIVDNLLVGGNTDSSDDQSEGHSFSPKSIRSLRHNPWVVGPLLCLILISIIAFISVLILLYDRSTPSSTAPPTATTCDVFCRGKLLSIIQHSSLFNDSKTFVDMPLLADPWTVLSAFNQLKDYSSTTLQSFLVEYFGEAGSDVVNWVPDDFNDNPPFLATIKDETFSNFGSAVHDLWKDLGREIVGDVYSNPSRHTMLPLLHPYMMVPGGRFREFYYWDSYWLVRGLVTSNMLHTAEIVIDNLLDMVDMYGFVPNGARQYYTSRSQPPFLSLMVDYYYNVSNDKDWLTNSLPLLDVEYNWWMIPDQHAVKLYDPITNTNYTLNRYYADVSQPRPESYKEDADTAASIHLYPSQNTSNSTSEWPQSAWNLFSELVASAESGWDFSSRWFEDRNNLSTAETRDMIPVDLNAVLYQVEIILSKLHAIVDSDLSLSNKYFSASQSRKSAIHSFLWDSANNIWRDYDYVEEELNGDVSVLSNWIPLWVKSYDSTLIDESKVIDALLTSNLVMAGGFVTSLDIIGQQWDCPNAWPPLQHMIIEGIATTTYIPASHSVTGALEQFIEEVDLKSIPLPYSPIPLSSTPSLYAASLSYYYGSRWLYSNSLAYHDYEGMFEKYYAPILGSPGLGGEYIVQTGFGWTNGIALLLLERYGQVLNHTYIKNLIPPVPNTDIGICLLHPARPI